MTDFAAEYQRQAAIAEQFAEWAQPIFDRLRDPVELEPAPDPEGMSADDLMDAIRKDQP